jgi:hypothetical protein
MLGFTLAMALPRFGLRKHLVMEEANAIATTSLRAGLLPAPQRSQVRALLLQYVRVRHALFASVPANGKSQPRLIAPSLCNLHCGKKQKKPPAKANRDDPSVRHFAE